MVYIVIYRITLKKLQNDIITDSKPVRKAPFYEALLGWFSIAIFVIHCIYKTNSKQLIFILNPCHVVGLVEGYLLVSPNGLHQRTVYTVLMNTLFSPWIAIIFPVTVGLTGPYEIPMFWVEHFLCAIINPLVLSLTHRYYTKTTISVRNHLFAHIIFAFYQRLVLFPMSQLTEANLNFTLCAARIDPFEPFIGKWYYVISEFYIFVGGEIFHRIVKILLDILKKGEALVFKHKHNVDDEVKNK